MKIDLSLMPLDKDGGTRSSAKGDKALGDAFDKAVRDVAPKVRKKDGVAAPVGEVADDRSSAGAKEADAEENIGDATAGPETSGEEADGPAEADAKTLKSLLGLLDGANQTASRLGAVPVEPSAQNAAGQNQDPKIADPDARQLDALAQSAVQDGVDGDPAKRAVRLDVLSMETHFEPRQDGMVLVTPPGGTAASRGGKAAAPAELPVAKTDAAGSSASRTDGAEEGVRLRFDEAVARLGRPSSSSGSGDGKGASRDGSAASHGAIVDLADRRSAARSSDGLVATAGSAATTPATSSSSTPFGLAGQVAGPIIEALGDSSAYSAPAFAPPGETHLKMRAGGAALKTLTIQLHPEQLGTLDVSMRLVEGKLAIELSASQSDTAAMLLDDRASLRKLLEHAGFSLDDAAITVVTRDVAAPKGAATSDTGADPRGAAGGSNGDGEAGRRSSEHGGGNEADRRAQRRAASEEPRRAQTRSGSTYL